MLIRCVLPAVLLAAVLAAPPAEAGAPSGVDRAAGVFLSQWGGGDWGGDYSGGGYEPATQRRKMVSLGVRAGVLLTNFWDEDFSSSSSFEDDPFLLSFGSEFFVGVQPHRFFRIQAGLGYTRLGTWVEYENPMGDVEMEITMDYFDVPVAFVGLIPTKSPVTPRLFGGLDFSIYLDGRIRSEFTFGGSTSEDTEELKPSAVTDFNVGFFAGFGAEFDIAGGACFLLDFRYTFTLTEISDDDSYWGSSMEDVKHEYFSITAGFSFPVG